jgi:hypothetical protein
MDAELERGKMVARLWAVRQGGVNRRGVSAGGERIYAMALPAMLTCGTVACGAAWG